MRSPRSLRATSYTAQFFTRYFALYSGDTLVFIRAAICDRRESKQADFQPAADLVVEHEGMLTELVTHKFSLDEVEKAFKIAGDKASRSVKAQFHP